MSNIYILSEEAIENNYKRYIKYLRSYINRDGIDEFIEWLDTTDVKVAPASTKYHLSCRGGLILHKLFVFKKIIALMDTFYPRYQATDDEGNLVWEDIDKTVPYMVSDCPYSKESIALVALCHDISKVDIYDIGYKNLPNKDTGVWEKTPYYYTKDQKDRLFFGTHSENSLHILGKYFDLTYDESIAILHHMGGSDYSDNDVTRQNAFTAFKTCPLAFMLYMADMSAVCLDEVKIG